MSCDPPREVSWFETGSFMTVTAFLAPDGTLVLEPPFRVDFRRREESCTDPGAGSSHDVLIVECADESGHTLTRVVLPMATACLFGAAKPEEWLSVADAVPFPARTALVRYSVPGRDVRVKSRKPERPPSIRFVRVPERLARDEETIAWQVTRASDAAIRSVIMFTHTDGRDWQAIAPPSAEDENKIRVRFGDLPGGRVRLRALVTDGFHTVLAESEPFENEVKGVRPMILSPTDGAKIAAHGETWFHGQAYDYEGQQGASVELVWRSSIDGEIGRGAVIAAALSPGEHTLTLRCGDHSVGATIHAVEGLG